MLFKSYSLNENYNVQKELCTLLIENINNLSLPQKEVLLSVLLKLKEYRIIIENILVLNFDSKILSQ